MTLLRRLGAALLVLLSMNVMAEGDSYANALNVFKESEICRKYFGSSYGYAIFPTVGKGGVVVGGGYGKGRVYRQGEMTGTAVVGQVSVGLQLGLQAYSEIVFFQDERAYQDFISGSFEFDATASAVAITAGAQAQAGTMGASAGVSAGPKTDKQLAAQYYKGMAVFTHAKGGLMYEISLAGQKFTFTPL